MQEQAPALFIETSTERAIVGFVKDGTVLYKNELPIGLNNSKYLAPAVEEGLQALGLILADAAYIGVGIGPGSYTGLRVGAMLAKSLAYAANIPLVGVCTLQCFAPLSDGPFAVMIDAKISGAYFISGFKSGLKIIYERDPQVLPLENIDSLLKDKMLILTPQDKVLREKLKDIDTQVRWEQAYPDLLQMARLAEQNLARGFVSKDGALELMYLRKTQAELEKERNGK